MQDELPDRDAILMAARLAGLHLPEAYADELVDAHAHIRALVARLPSPRARGDEPAHVFDPARLTADEGQPRGRRSSPSDGR